LRCGHKLKSMLARRAVQNDELGEPGEKESLQGGEGKAMREQSTPTKTKEIQTETKKTTEELDTSEREKARLKSKETRQNNFNLNKLGKAASHHRVGKNHTGKANIGLRWKTAQKAIAGRPKTTKSLMTI